MTDSENQEKISSTSSEKSTSQDHVSCDKTSAEQPGPSVHTGNSQDISSSSSSEDNPSSSEVSTNKLRFWLILIPIVGLLLFGVHKCTTKMEESMDRDFEKMAAIANRSMFSCGRVTPDELEELVKQAESGDEEAQFKLGEMYLFGESIVPKDYLKAAKWLRQAAEQGHAEARFNLGYMYYDGEGVAQDYAEAAKWFRLAAEDGIAGAQYNLGVAYDKGQGVAQDYAKAAEWYQKAAEQGHASAQNNLGVMYANGEGVPRDQAKAVE